MAFAKIGFHMGTPCNGCTGMGEMWRRLNEAGVPFGVYSVNNGGIVAVDGLRYSQAKWLVYRDKNFDYVPYHAAATPEAGRNLWAQAEAALPPEVRANKSRIWVEMFNEPSKEESGATTTEMVAAWQYHTAVAAVAAGYRFCGPGWAAGTPEPSAWRGTWMRRYLELCAAKPEQVAVTIHEYSYNEYSIMAGYPYQVGRFMALFAACDEMGIARPTVFISELGWTLDNMPEPSRAMEDINTVAALYAGHSQIKAAFLWSLIGGQDKVALAQKLNGLIEPVTQYTLDVRWPDPPAPPQESKLHYIDVSHHQTVDWGKVAPKLNGVFIRFGYGVTEDRKARQNVAECRRRGVPFVGYHYFIPTLDAAAQGVFFGRLAREIAPGVRLAVDLEEKAGVATPAALLESADDGWLPPARFEDDVAGSMGEAGLLESGGVADLPERARRYIDALTAIALHNPVIYTSPGYWRGWMKSPAWGALHDLWIAHWGVNRPDVPTPWTTWKAWQYNVLPVSQSDWPVGTQALDFDQFAGTPAEFRAWATVIPPVVDVAAAIRADAATRPAPTWNPTHALPLAALTQKFYPFGEEYDVAAGGKTYRYVRAMDAMGKRRAYWAAVGDWGNVKAVDLA